MNEENIVVTEMKSDGSYETTEVPAEEFNSAEYVSTTSESKKGSVFVGIAAVVGIATGIYGAYKGARRLCRIYKAGVEALHQEELVVTMSDDEVIEESEDEMKEFIDKRKKEK